MLEAINYFLMIVTITTGIFMMIRYVFLEPGMEPKKQQIFYIVGYIAMLIGYITLGASAGQIVPVLLGGLNIVLGRKKHRVWGFFLIVPLLGIMDGFCGPIIVIQLLLLPINYTLGMIGLLAMYTVFGVFLLLFYLKGKQWRRWFAENMKNRRPRLSEYVVLCVSGCALLIANTVNSYIMSSDSYDFGLEPAIQAMGVVFYLIAFLLAVTIIVLIMQGNVRKFYHDRVAGMQFNMIATMADIVENRDSNTGGHIKRTAKYVEIVGKNLKKQNAFPETLTEQYLDDMVVAAPLHDIGKISIPDAILNKPGRLTDEEFTIMKTHTTAGREALQKAESQLGEFDYLNVAQDMAEYHHEWWNGNGYPNGISGEEIPLCARIMAVADVFDALTSKRCYKDAMPLQKAYDIIRSETGTHFDPVVGETFLNAHKEIEKAMEEIAPDEA